MSTMVSYLRMLCSVLLFSMRTARQAKAVVKSRCQRAASVVEQGKKSNFLAVILTRSARGATDIADMAMRQDVAKRAFISCKNGQLTDEKPEQWGVVEARCGASLAPKERFSSFQKLIHQCRWLSQLR